MSFPLKGNGNVKAAVCAAAKNGRIPHAILIEGEQGTGRHTLARYIASAAVCTGENRPCGVCRCCHLAQGGNNPDITVTAPEDKKKNIAVSQIRQLRAEAFVKPHMSPVRVFIIDKADTMNEQSQNALLKVLEEPPENVVFILIAESKSALLDTVISRCVTFSLYPPELSDASECVRQHVKKSVTDEEISSALSTTHNNIGKALVLLNGKKDEGMRSAAISFLNNMFGGSEYEMLKILSAYEKDRVGADAFFKELKYQTAQMLRREYKNPLRAKALNSFYGELSSFEESLKTNINLALLFSAAVNKAHETAGNIA